MDAPLSPQISLEDLATNVSLLAALSTDASGAAVSPVDSAASAAASDDAAPADDSRAPTALLIGAAEGTVPLVTGADVDAAVPSAEAGTLVAPPTDAVGKTVPLVAGAAAGTAADAVLADDVGASATPFDDTAGKTRVPVTASAAGARRCCCSKCHCRRRRLPRSLRQGERRHLHIFRLKPLLNSPAITAEKRFRKRATFVLPVTCDRRDSS